MNRINYFAFLVGLLGFFMSASALAQNFSVVETLDNGRNPWSMSLFSLASIEPEKADEGGRLSTYNYLSFNRRLSSHTRFAVRTPFIYNSYGYDRFNAGQVQDQELFLQDVFFSYTDYNIALLPGDIEVFWEGRVYIPTSQHSQDTKMVTRLRNDLIFSKLLTHRVQLSYINKFNYYHQSRTAYRNTFIGDEGDEITVTSLTKRMEVDHWLELWYALNPETGIGFKVGGEDTWWNRSEIENKEKAPEHLLKVGPSFRFSLTNSMNFIFSVDSKVAHISDLGRLNPEHINVALLSFIRF